MTISTLINTSFQAGINPVEKSYTPILFSSKDPNMKDPIVDTVTLDNTAQKTMTRINPATGKADADISVASKEDVQQAVANAKAHLAVWRNTPLKTRKKIFEAVATDIGKRADELATLLSRETGKPVKDAIEADVSSAISIINYYANVGPKVLKDKPFNADKSYLMGRRHVTRYEPKGVVGVISPWNYPLAIAASGVATALMAGNTVILKPSELSPEIGKVMIDIFRTHLKANNLPEDIAQVVLGDGEAGKHLIDSDIDYAIFTGSHGTGSKIRETMQAKGKEVSLELGGSDPMIILEDADLDMATSYALWGRFANAGQTCAAVKRLYVPRKHFDKVLDLMKTKTEALIVGDPDDENVHMGPLVSERQREEIADQVQDAIDKGATVVTGGKKMERDGWYYEPTILTNAPDDARVINEEVFGPVLPIIPYDTVKEAIELANGLPFGLTASVFGSTNKATEIAKQLEAGCVMVNDTGATNYAMPSVPWSGWKNSGPGTSHSPEALFDASNRQTLTTNLLQLMPGFKKQPWHFGSKPDKELAKSLVDNFASQSPLRKLNPKFWWQVVKNRSSKKI